MIVFISSGWFKINNQHSFNDISYILYNRKVTTGVHWAVNQQTTSTLVHLHTDLPTLHCTIIFLCLSLSCLLCSVIDSCSDIQVIIRIESHAGSSVQDSDEPFCRKESRALDIVMTTLVVEKEMNKFLQHPEPWDHDKLKSVGHDSSIKGEKIWKYITLQLSSSCHKRKSATLMTWIHL